MEIYQCSDRREIINPGGIFDPKVDTAVTHRSSKIIMPVGAVQPIAFVKVHHIRHVRQVPAHTGHICVTIANIYVILTGYRRVSSNPGGNDK